MCARIGPLPVADSRVRGVPTPAPVCGQTAQTCHAPVAISPNPESRPSVAGGLMADRDLAEDSFERNNL